MIVTPHQARSMAEAHAEGQHADQPREGCPDCPGHHAVELQPTGRQQARHNALTAQLALSVAFEAMHKALQAAERAYDPETEPALPGCALCTSGAVPDRCNTGPCHVHLRQQALQLAAKALAVGTPKRRQRAAGVER